MLCTPQVSTPIIETRIRMMDLEREQLRKTYQVCRLGFALLSVALGLACIIALLPLLASFFHGEVAFLMFDSYDRVGMTGSLYPSPGVACSA